ncbi:MAG: pitrilysin family protein [Alphaproteobacteria bacterium]|nr:pitrilysin family protein [Alphaproteobacteria bacterium]
MPMSVAQSRSVTLQLQLHFGSLLVLLTLLLLGMLSLAPPASAAVFNPKTFTLANGMQVVVIENRRVPIVSHMVWYRVGSADETPGKSGIAHFLEHLMFRGTKTLAPGEFSRTVARNGGQENAFTSYDYTGYFQNVAVDRLEIVMRLEADRMTNLVLTDEVVNPERDVVLEERRSRTENRPGGLLREQAGAAMFANHPYGMPIIGWKHEIQALKTEDALAFYRRHYAPNNAILIVAGDVSVDQVRTLAERYYGPIPAGSVPERVRPQEPPQHAPRRVVLRDVRVGQPRFSRRYLAPSYNRGATEHAYPLQLLSEILGGGSTSRLYRSLVIEQKLAAAAGAWYNPNSFDLGSIGVSATPRPGVDVADVEAAVDAELHKILDKGVTADELARAKDRMEAGAIYARDDLSTGARVFGVALTTGRTVEDVETWPERIAAVTIEQVQAAARAVFVANNSVTSLLLPKTSDQTE